MGGRRGEREEGRKGRQYTHYKPPLLQKYTPLDKDSKKTVVINKHTTSPVNYIICTWTCTYAQRGHEFS